MKSGTKDYASLGRDGPRAGPSRFSAGRPGGRVDARVPVAIIVAIGRCEMRIASVKEVKDNLSYFLRIARKENVIITKNGKPTAILHHLDDDEIEDYLLEHDPKFRRKIERRWKEYLRDGGRSVDEILKELGG
jgi:antitoxin (DNA-binding transcriptional repressor) of toxin-antitoxin stability system